MALQSVPELVTIHQRETEQLTERLLSSHAGGHKYATVCRMRAMDMHVCMNMYVRLKPMKINAHVHRPACQISVG